ncbi:hypothetical protein [Streptomyces canus]|uniref:hypothetical protein n=1 Tax=Streptomyces canus TaxID=58343 RepID=UPI00371BBCB7
MHDTSVNEWAFGHNIFGGAFLADLPHYTPDNPARTAAQRDLVDSERSGRPLRQETRPGRSGARR